MDLPFEVIEQTVKRIEHLSNLTEKLAQQNQALHDRLVILEQRNEELEQEEKLQNSREQEPCHWG